MSETEIAILDAATFPAAVAGLGEVLHAAVLRGASVGFVFPFTLAAACAFWQAQGDAVTLARRLGRCVLVLDTATGSDAQRLYRGFGWTEAGVIPHYAADVHGRPESTTYMFKELADA